MKILDQVVAVFLDVHLWTGRKKLRLEDLKVTAGSIPPEKLASLGSKKICDPTDLAIFATLKKRAERACEAVGVKFLGGFTVPVEKAKELVLELEGIQREFATEKRNFLSRYDEALELWIADNQEWASIIRASLEPVETVERQLRFSHQLCRINMVEDDADGILNQGLAAKVGTLGDRLIYEVSRDAEKTWEQSFRGKDKVTQKALRPVRALLEKLRGLSFLDGRASNLVHRVEAGLNALPKHGPIEGQDFNALIGLVLMLADPEGVKDLQVAGDADSVYFPTSSPVQEDSCESEEDETENEVDTVPSPAPPKTQEVAKEEEPTGSDSKETADETEPELAAEVAVGWF